MPAILKDKKQYLVSKVRSIIAQDHQMSPEELQLRLEREYCLKFERHYFSAPVSVLALPVGPPNKSSVGLKSLFSAPVTGITSCLSVIRSESQIGGLTRATIPT
jgi:hypothetical protein